MMLHSQKLCRRLFDAVYPITQCQYMILSSTDPQSGRDSYNCPCNKKLLIFFLLKYSIIWHSCYTKQTLIWAAKVNKKRHQTITRSHFSPKDAVGYILSLPFNIQFVQRQWLSNTDWRTRAAAAHMPKGKKIKNCM